MPINTGKTSVDQAVWQLIEKLVSPNADSSNILGQIAVIREAASHDFSNYKFLLEPYFIGENPPDGSTVLNEPSDVPLNVWIDFETFLLVFGKSLTTEITSWLRENVSFWVNTFNPYNPETLVDDLISEGHWKNLTKYVSEAFRMGMAPELYGAYTTTVETKRFIIRARLVVSKWLETQIAALIINGRLHDQQLSRLYNPMFWQAGARDVLDTMGVFKPILPDSNDTNSNFDEPLPANYDFQPFMPESVNFGLQIIHRQDWIPLGTQSGEIVRTLPLGPKQVEKITVKAVRRTKSTRQSEIVTSVETAMESSAATKDSSEIVQEASESFNWHAEASASGSWGFGSASISGGMGGEEASSSRDAKSMLNESMEKTSSKVRTDTKIIVSTESEASSEFTQVSEISNPNDEIAVTYIYSRLQRQYEIHTFLAEVNTVIFVAERIPAPAEITSRWIRRYDWIIARELLDDSFRSDLEVIRYQDPGPVELEDIDERISSLMESLSSGGLPDYATLSGEIPDLFAKPQQAYEREVERRRARQTDYERFYRSLRRLKIHIYDNILHYCRAIWSSEDPDARLLRYSKIKVPIRWDFVATGSATSHVIPGYYTPVIYDKNVDTIPLSEIINPAGPIGFAGNYSVYYLKESTRWETLMQALSHLKLPYLKMVVDIESEREIENINTWGIVSAFRLGSGNYRIVFEIGTTSNFRVFQEQDGVFVEIDLIPAISGEPIEFHSLRISIDPLESLSSGDAFLVRVFVLPQLEDPELKSIRWLRERLDPIGEDAFYTSDVVKEFGQFFADIQNALENEMSNLDWMTLSEATRELIRNRHFTYLMRKYHTRRILVDTNNVVLSRQIDSYSTLEPFKGLHRLADVLDAYSDLESKQLEVKRRQERLDSDLLSDPEIERLTVVASADNLGALSLFDDMHDEDDE